MRKKWGILGIGVLLLLFAGIVSCAQTVEEKSAEQVSLQTGEETEEGEEVNQNIFYVTVEDRTFTADFAEGTSAGELKRILEDGPITIEMNDYGGFEKLGALEIQLPTSDSRIAVQPGDLVLYQGRYLVMFYGNNTWSYTRLGRISELDGWEEALQGETVSVSLSLKEP